MKISVVLPCHNARQTIAGALQSVATQTLAPHEIIVVNDSSTDDSIEVARESGVDFELQTVSARNAGAARNAGIKAATGDWIALLDADDLWLPHHLQQAIALLDEGDVAYMANHRFLTENGEEPIPDSMLHNIESARGLAGAQWVAMQPRGFHFGHSTVIYRRERVNELGGFDTHFARQEDLDLWLRMIASGTWAYGAREAALYRTDTPGSLSKNLAGCEIFYLRAWLKNRALFPPEATNWLIQTSARHSMSLAFVDGTMADFRRAHAQAKPHLSRKLATFYALAPLVRPLAQSAIRLKRRWVWRNRNEIGE